MKILGDRAEQLLLQELDQSWEHYRHLEDTRVKYLGFYFTILLGSIGIVATIGPRVPQKPDGIALLLVFASAYLAAFFAMNMIIYAAVRRLGVVLKSYDTIMTNIREYFRGAHGYPEQLFVRPPFAKTRLARFLGIQRQAEILLVTSAVVIVGLQVADTVWAFAIGASSLGCLSAVIAVGMCGILVAMQWIWHITRP